MYSELEKKIKYEFKDKKIIETAMTHSSLSNETIESKLGSYERLEFLGDSVLNMLVTDYLFFKYPKKHEGELSKIRAFLVSEKTLAKISKKLSLNSFLKINKGAKNINLGQKKSVLADMFESVVAAIYIDGGIEKAKEFCIRYISQNVETAVSDYEDSNYKSKLQEIIQKEKKHSVSYVVDEITGPAHDLTFFMYVEIAGRKFEIASGKTKREAGQLAAKNALKELSSSKKNKKI